MKPRLCISAALLLICNILGAQTYRYTFTHDTLGNRVSRVYQGSIPAKGVCLVAESKEDVAGCFSITDDPGEAQELNSASPLSVNDTLYDPLDKTPAEKEAYLQAMMDEVMRMKPYKVRRDRGPSSNYAVGEVPLSYGVSNSGGRLFLVWNSQLLV